MSISINSVCLLGRLTKDPEKRVTQSGLSTCSFTLAVDRRHKKDSDQEQTADFIQCVAWRQSADYICNYGHKGDQVGVIGRIQTRNYDDKDGRKIYVTEVVCDSVQLQSNGTYQDAASTGMALSSDEYRQKKAEASAADPADPLNQQINDDLPF